MEKIIEIILKSGNMNIYSFIAIVLVIIYGLAILIFKWKMRNNPKIEKADGTKKYR